jgi:hypothetical protein
MADVLTFPCEIEFLIHVLGIATVQAFIVFRSILFIVETQIQQSVQTNSEKFESLTKRYLFGSIWSIIFGSIQHIELSDLVNVRRNAIFISVSFFFPPIVCYLVTVALIPIYHFGCSGCPLYNEALIIMHISPVLMMPVYLRLAYIMYKIQIDAQHVARELLLLVCFPATLSLSTKLFIATIDPGDLALNRVLTWEWINVFVAEFGFWMVSFGILFIEIFFEKKQEPNLVLTRSISFMVDVAQSDVVRFFQFAASRYCCESLNYLETIRLFEANKDDGLEKRKLDAKKIIRRFIAVGSVEEINVSEFLRNDVLNIDLNVSSRERINSMFSPTMSEVSRMIQTGPWIEFMTLLKKEERLKINTSL